MIDRIRRRFAKSIGMDPTKAAQEKYPYSGESDELQKDAAVHITAASPPGEYAPENANSPDYYKSLVRTAIKNGGKYGDQHISVPWLRMILAGLESKPMDPEMMWSDVEAGDKTTGPPSGIPSYADLFPSGRN